MASVLMDVLRGLGKRRSGGMGRGGEQARAGVQMTWTCGGTQDICDSSMDTSDIFNDYWHRC